MRRYILIFITFTAIFSGYSFFLKPQLSPAAEVKNYYLKAADNFIATVKDLKAAISEGNLKKSQQQFLKTREAYKQMELMVEYYFAFYATKINGAPIVLFEEAEPDIAQQPPYGLQVIEEILFTKNMATEKEVLNEQINELLRIAIELPQVNESIYIDDENNFDAFIEEVYRITALSITGFDSQAAVNSLPETATALKSLQKYISFYKDNFERSLPGKYEALNTKLSEAAAYVEIQKDFNAFDRMHFIITYLNPIANLIGSYKTTNGLKDNSSGPYYSAIKKYNTLFTPGAFDPNRFLDDYKTSPEKIALGKKLFFENRLSTTQNRSCASCHIPGKAFTDALPTSLALDGHSPLPRNAPTIWNAALQRNLFADSRARNLEDQVMEVLNNTLEMGGSAENSAAELIKMPEYKVLYEKAFQQKNKRTIAQNLSNAIASYERTLIALNSRFDKHMNGQPNLTKKEINGFNLFMGKAKCGTCHFTPLFSGAKPPRYYYIESEVIGVPENLKRKTTLDNDSGRYLITGFPVHLFAFKTPTLRNIELTGPYMHNGVFNTLEEVVSFYNKGGGKGLHIAPENQTLPFDNLKLSRKEQKEIVAFMKTLTDTSSVY